MSADLSIQPAFGGNRLLYACIVFSMLAHLAVMWRAPHVEPREAPPPRITATLRQAEPALPPAMAAPEPPPLAQERPEPPRPAPAEVRQPPPPEPRPQKLKPDAAPVVRVEPVAPVPAPAAAPAPAAVAPAVAPVQADARPDARAERETAKPAAVPAPASPEFSERALIDLYQSQIASIIETRKLKRYPNEAMQNNWEGTVTVVLKIGTDGKVAGVETGSSSGHELLDEQARISLSKAKPYVQIPEGLKGKAFDARVRVVFSLAK